MDVMDFCEAMAEPFKITLLLTVLFFHLYAFTLTVHRFVFHMKDTDSKQLWRETFLKTLALYAFSESKNNWLQLSAAKWTVDGSS